MRENNVEDDFTGVAISAAVAIRGSERHHVSEFAQSDNVANRRARVDEAFEWFFLEPSKGPLAHSFAAARRLLDNTDADPQSFDALLVCSDLQIDTERTSLRQELFRSLQELSITRAYPYSVFSSECSNVAAGLSLGCALINSNKARKILLLASESRGRPLLSLNSGAVMSDSAVALVLEKTSGVGLRLLDILCTFDNNLATIRSGFPSSQPVSLAVLQAARRIRSSHGHLIDRAIQNGHCPVFPNMPAKTQKLWASELGFSEPFRVCDTTSELGHAGPADFIANLAKGLHTGFYTEGQRVLTMHPGSYVWNMAVARVGDMRYFTKFDALGLSTPQGAS